MSKHPAASREDHDSFCNTEAWELTRGATGQPVKHHRTYILRLWDGRILRTRISRPVDGSQYAASTWSHILRNQLETTADAFWACVQSGTLPDRGAPAVAKLRKSVPLHLYRALQGLNVSDAQLADLDAAGAADLYARLLRGE